jgi:hypothetical protein
MAIQTPKIVEHDARTGETVVRDFSAAELEALEKREVAENAKKAELATKRQALLDKLGITEEEANLLLS